jgi:hypothetical protein
MYDVHHFYYSPRRTAAHLGRLSHLGTGYKSDHDSTSAQTTLVSSCRCLWSAPTRSQSLLLLLWAWHCSRHKRRPPGPPPTPSHQRPAHYPVTCLSGIDGFTRALDHGNGVGRVSELPVVILRTTNNPGLGWDSDIHMAFSANMAMVIRPEGPPVLQGLGTRCFKSLLHAVEGPFRGIGACASPRHPWTLVSPQILGRGERSFLRKAPCG